MEFKEILAFWTKKKSRHNLTGLVHFDGGLTNPG
jgi:hypothetical protein